MRLVVPKCMRLKLLNETHDQPLSGHLGIIRTLHRLKQHFFWPKMARDVRSYVRRCHKCNSFKPTNQRAQGQLQSIEPPHQPFEMIGLDYAGPFLTTAAGNKCIIAVTDYLTKWVETRAVPSASAEHAIAFLQEQIFFRHGTPQRILTDNGAQFTAKTFEKCLSDRHVHHSKTSKYHPQTNGQIERINRTFGLMLAAQVRFSSRRSGIRSCRRLRSHITQLSTSQQAKYPSNLSMVGWLSRRPSEGFRFHWSRSTQREAVFKITLPQLGKNLATRFWRPNGDTGIGII